MDWLKLLLSERRCTFSLYHPMLDYHIGLFFKVILRDPQIRYSGAKCYSENIRGNSLYQYGLCASEQAW